MNARRWSGGSTRGIGGRSEVAIEPGHDSAVVVFDVCLARVRHTVTAVRVLHPLDVAAQPTKGVEQLASLALIDVVILSAGDDQDRGADAVGEHDRRVLRVLL